MANFFLCCVECGRQYDGVAGVRLRCDGEVSGEHGAALLRAQYECRQIKVRADLPGIFKFVDWLPSGPYYLKTELGHLGEPYCYRSTNLAKRLGLTNLYIGFSGYWPERGSNLPRGLSRNSRFKEVPCASCKRRVVGLRRHSSFLRPATRLSYSYYTHLMGLPLYLFVPERGLGTLLLPFKPRRL